jgi:hypothetical protein
MQTDQPLFTCHKDEGKCFSGEMVVIVIASVNTSGKLAIIKYT